MSLNLDRALRIKIGGTTRQDLEWLAETSGSCQRIVELGSCQGRSTRAMLDNSGAHIWCVDTWQGPVVPLPSRNYQVTEKDFQLFLSNIEDVWGRIEILKMSTYKAWKQLPLASFDMVFIDADHSYEAVKFDIVHYAPLLKPGGLLCGHDYEAKKWPDVSRAVRELISSPKRGGSYIWWIRR